MGSRYQIKVEIESKPILFETIRSLKSFVSCFSTLCTHFSTRLSFLSGFSNAFLISIMICILFSFLFFIFTLVFHVQWIFFPIDSSSFLFKFLFIRFFFHMKCLRRKFKQSTQAKYDVVLTFNPTSKNSKWNNDCVINCLCVYSICLFRV